MSLGPYISEYNAKVIDNLDPEKIGRIRVSCPEVFGNITVSDWIPSSQGHSGQMLVPEINDIVIVTCKDGDPNRMRYRTITHKEKQSPSSSTNKIDDFGNKGKSAFKTCGEYEVKEPPSPQRSEYPKIKTLMENEIALIELDDNGRFQYFNKKTKHFMEWHPDGTLVIKAKKVYLETDEDLAIKSNGRFDISTLKDFTLNLFEDLNLWIKKEFMISVSESISAIASKVFNIGVGHGLNIDADKRINVASRGNITVVGKKIDRVSMDDKGV